MEILKKTKSLGELVIKRIEKNFAKELIVKNHYSKSWNQGGFGVYNFGIFRKEDMENCLGVAVYGYMKNPKARIFEHPSQQAWMIELNRMWIHDSLGKNSETILISSSLKLLKKLDRNIVAVQSFADGRLGCGTIYKASNFKYYGFHTTKFARNKRTGAILHNQNFTNTTCTSSYLRNNIGYLIGDFEVFQVKTYRYIYALSRHFVFTLKKEQPYPKYEKGLQNIKWERNHTILKDHIVKMVYSLKQ